MRLSDIFSQKSVSVRSEGSISENMTRQIRSLTPGKVIQGEVLEKNGGEVKIRLDGDMVLTAHLDQDVNVEAGRLLTFEVRNNGSLLSLSPLFTNTANTDTVFKALQMAGLPVNGSTVAMTDAMMQNGMSIDSRSLQSMFKEIMAFSQADPADIVLLHRLGTEVSEENLTQLQNYRNLSYHLLQGMDDILSGLPGAFEQAVAAGGEQSGVKMYQALLGIFLEDAVVQDPKAAASSKAESGAVQESGAKDGQVLENAAGESVPAGEGLTREGQIPDNAAGQAVPPRNGMSPETIPLREAGFAEGRLPLEAEERNTLAQLLEAFSKEGTPEMEKLLSGIRQGSADTKEILEFLARAQGGADTEKALADIFKSPEFGKLFREQILEQWTIEPEEVMRENKVEELYHRLQRQLDNMKEILQNSGAGQTVAAKNAGSFSQNLDFMNQMNHMYTYVQLPLKMAGGQTTGDLYVYTNKRSLAQKDGNISALLHLDMENLGPLDVYIAMQQEKISTRFTVRDDDMLDFLNDHIHVLNERLEKKGYAMRCEMTVRESGEEEGPIERILNVDRNNTVLAQYGFDVRT